MSRSGMESYIDRLIEKLYDTQFLRGTQESPSYEEGVQLLVDVFTEHKQAGNQVFFIGNGGSAAIASHMTADFMKNGGMKTYSLYDNAVMTCMSNDYGYENIFSRPLAFLAKQGDLLVAISSSGNSPNIIRAIDTVTEKKGVVVTFTGFCPDNKAKQRGDINVYVPCEKYGMVESIHSIILQQVVDTILERDGARL